MLSSRLGLPGQRRTGRDSQRGQLLVIVAGGFLALLALAALVLEGGTVVLNRRDAQNSADLAALAGTRIVALNYSSGGRTQAQVRTEIGRVADQNGCSSTAGTPCEWSAQFVGGGLTDLGNVGNTSAPLPSGTLGVQVGVTRHPGTILGRLPPISRDQWDVSTEATAITGRPSTFPGGIILPVALCGYTDRTVDPPRCLQATASPPNAIDFQPGQIYDLTDGKDAPGAFAWLRWHQSDTPSTGVLATSLCNANNPPFSLDSPYDDPHGSDEVWFYTGNGKMNASQIRACLDGWIASGATVLVPIFDLVEGTGTNVRYHVTGVAAFVLTAREQPAVDQIQGYFVQYYGYTDVPGGLGSQAPDPGDTTYFIGLVR
jgi:hypothetical protein